MSDEADYKDYQDYLEYLKHINGPQLSQGPDVPPQPATDRIHTDAMIERGQKEHPFDPMSDPVYKYGLGLASEVSLPQAIRAGVKALPGIGNKLKEFLAPAAKRAGAREALQGPDALGYLQNTAANTAEKFNKSQIGPRMLEQESRLKGNTIRLNPEDLKGVSPELDQYAQSIAVQKPATDSAGYSTITKQSDFPSEASIEIPAEEGLKVRKMLNDAAGWKQHPTDPTRAKAVDDKAASLHSWLSDQFHTIDPSMEPLSQEMQNAYNVQKAATGKALRVPGVNSAAVKDAAVRKYGEMSGVDLQGLGEVANESGSSSINPFAMTSPKGIVKETLKSATGPIKRGYENAAHSFVNQEPVSSSDKLRALFNTYKTQNGDQQ